MCKACGGFHELPLVRSISFSLVLLTKPLVPLHTENEGFCFLYKFERISKPKHLAFRF